MGNDQPYNGLDQIPGFGNPVKEMVDSAVSKGVVTRDLQLTESGRSVIDVYEPSIERVVPQLCLVPYNINHSSPSDDISPRAYTLLLLPKLAGVFFGDKASLNMFRERTCRENGVTVADAGIAMVAYFRGFFEKEYETIFDFDAETYDSVKESIGLDQSVDDLIQNGEGKNLITDLEDPCFQGWHLFSDQFRSEFEGQEAKLYEPALKWYLQEKQSLDPSFDKESLPAKAKSEPAYIVQWLFRSFLVELGKEGLRETLDRLVKKHGEGDNGSGVRITVGELFGCLGYSIERKLIFQN